MDYSTPLSLLTRIILEGVNDDERNNERRHYKGRNP